jgi:hypothetical protein
MNMNLLVVVVYILYENPRCRAKSLNLGCDLGLYLMCGSTQSLKNRVWVTKLPISPGSCEIFL